MDLTTTDPGVAAAEQLREERQGSPVTSTTLGLKMHNRAQQDRLPADHPMRTTAVQFAKACEGYFAEPQTVECPEFLRAWTRARLAWCKYTNEPLI